MSSSTQKPQSRSSPMAAPGTAMAASGRYRTTSQQAWLVGVALCCLLLVLAGHQFQSAGATSINIWKHRYPFWGGYGGYYPFWGGYGGGFGGGYGGISLGGYGRR